MRFCPPRAIVLRISRNERSNDPEDVPGYTDEKLPVGLFVSSLFSLYNEKNVLHVLRPFQTYRIFQGWASKCWTVVGIRDFPPYLVIKQEHVIVECQSDRADRKELHVRLVLHLSSTAVAERTFPVGQRTAGIGPRWSMSSGFC